MNVELDTLLKGLIDHTHYPNARKRIIRMVIEAKGDVQQIETARRLYVAAFFMSPKDSEQEDRMLDGAIEGYARLGDFKDEIARAYNGAKSGLAWLRVFAEYYSTLPSIAVSLSTAAQIRLNQVGG